MSKYKIVVAILVVLAIFKTSTEAYSYYEVYKVDYIRYPLLAITALLLVGYFLCFCDCCCSSKTLVNALALVTATDLVLKLAVIVAIGLLVYQMRQKNRESIWLLLIALVCCILNAAFFYFLRKFHLKDHRNAVSNVQVI